MSARGFSTLEIMIALMIMSTTLAAVALVALGLPAALLSGRSQIEALSHSNALLQQELRIGTNSFSEVSSISTSTSSGYDSGLVSTLQPDGITKKLVSTTRWKDPSGIYEYATLSSVVTDFEDISTNGGCDSVPIGDWTNPQEKIVNALFPATYLPQALAAGTSTLAIGVASTTSRNAPTIFLYSTASPTNPIFEGDIDNATTTRSGITALAINGNTLYAASGNASNFATCTTSASCSQLEILDASNPNAPVVISTFQLATSSGPFASGSGGQAMGKTLLYANGLLYVGLQKTAALPGQTQNTGDEFDIIDVHNPRAPVWLGGYSVGRTVNQIQVVNGYAYLATDDPIRELIVLDVHTPTNPTFAESYDAPGSTLYGYGESVAVASTTVMLGRSYEINGPGFSFLNAFPSISVLSSTTESSSVLGIELQNFLAFVLTSTHLEVWNSSNPTLLVPYASSTISFQGTPTALLCSGSALYVTSATANQGYLTILTGS